MRPRDPHEPGRVASSLELFFDLVFVVAVSNAAANLHHSLSEGHVGHGLYAYAVIFFGIWWAWMNFTWFATSFDTDDWLYRVITIVQMGGVLVLSAGVEPLFAHGDMTVAILAYVLMRVAMVAQWLRASRCGGAEGRSARLYAAGITVVQVLWLLLLLVPGPGQTVGLVLLIAAELAVPIVAERNGGTPWHPHHITERYGLFTLFVLGEGLLASANAIIEAMHEHEEVLPLIGVSALTLVVTAALWWLYFWPPHHRAIDSFGHSLRYGYVHYFVFAAAGAFSAGIEAEIDLTTHHTELGSVAAAYAVALPIAVFVLGVWWLAMRAEADRTVNVAVPVAVLLTLICPLLPVPVAVVAVILVVLVIVLVRHPPRERVSESAG